MIKEHGIGNRACDDCGKNLPTSQVVVIMEGTTYRFCDRCCGAAFLGNLDPRTGCPL